VTSLSKYIQYNESSFANYLPLCSLTKLRMQTFQYNVWYMNSQEQSPNI